jgi:hypothetical protein
MEFRKLNYTTLTVSLDWKQALKEGYVVGGGLLDEGKCFAESCEGKEEEERGIKRNVKRETAWLSFNVYTLMQRDTHSSCADQSTYRALHRANDVEI